MLLCDPNVIYQINVVDYLIFSRIALRMSKRHSVFSTDDTKILPTWRLTCSDVASYAPPLPHAIRLSNVFIYIFIVVVRAATAAATLYRNLLA